MKKSALIIITAVVTALLLSVSAFAGSYDDVFDKVKISKFASYPQGTLDAVQLRAFAVDPNGKYYYCGFLNSGTPTVYQFDASTGKEVTKYTFKEDNGAYIKAIGTDDRGYVYMGIANAANNGAVYFSICTEKGLAEQKWIKIDIDGKVGVNGAYARQIDGKYYLWFVTNYDTDRIYCYDVTDVKNPVPNTAFGNNGVLELSGFGITDANNLTVDAAGNIYVCCNTGAGSKGDTVFKLDAKGSNVLAKGAVEECFGICQVGEYLAVCTMNKESSVVVILNQSDLTAVKTINYDSVTKFSQIGFANDKLYIADEGPDAVAVSTTITIPAPAEPAASGDSGSPSTADSLSAAVMAVMASAAVLFISKKSRH